jgi:methionyl-tRNA formyltransferase
MSPPPPLRLVFMGTPDFAGACLMALLGGPDMVVAVVTQPDKGRGRGKKVTPSPVKVIAEAADIPVLQPAKIRTVEFCNGLRSYQPDLIVVAAYGRILPPPLLNIAPLGCINVHGSLLPHHRGAAPVQWTVLKGEEEAGITIIQMDEGLDTGDMLLKAKLKTEAEETAGSLAGKLAALGGETLLKAIRGLKEGTLIPVPQDHGKASLAPMLRKEDGLIDWRQDAGEIACRIRGLDPWPTAFTFLDGHRLQLFRPQVVYRQSDHPPGTVLQADASGLLVACGRNALLIREVQPEGKKRMAADAFLRGRKIAAESVLGRQEGLR